MKRSIILCVLLSCFGLANETNRNVWFDDLSVQITPSQASQENHYSPYGLNLAGIEKNGRLEHLWQYQGKEKYASLMYYDFGSRYYDPQLGKWHATDPQGYLMPYHSTYVGFMNNPLTYIDPDGEFPILAELAGLTNGLRNLVSGGNFFQGFADGWTNSWKITGGIFQWDGDLNFGQNLWNTFSKLTWELPQTATGLVVSQTLNIGTLVNDVNYFRGATVLDTDLEGGAFTAGSYIIGPEGFRPDFRDHLFVHEFGHYLQSKRLGFGYLPLVALPSVTDFFLVDELFGSNLHDTRWYEAEASRLAANYFDREFGAGSEGYVAGSPDFFDRNSFVTEALRSPYINPRNGGRNPGGNPIQSRFHWTDIPINLLFNGGVGLFGYLFN